MKPNKKEVPKDIWEAAPEKLKPLIATSVPVLFSEFQGSVNNGDKVPETNFSALSGASSRRVDMLWNPYCLICHHHGKYFTVPNAMQKFTYFK